MTSAARYRAAGGALAGGCMVVGSWGGSVGQVEVLLLPAAVC